MRHNQLNPPFAFHKEPADFSKATEKSLLQYCLGATLYMPGTREIINKVIDQQVPELTSMVMCLEDAVSEEELSDAETNVIKHLQTIYDAIGAGKISHEQIPLTFIRVRNPKQFTELARRLSRQHLSVLTGFVFPKFYSSNALQYLELLADLNDKHRLLLYGMPILEGRTIAFIETREAELAALKRVLEPFRDLILNIRVGGTDFSAIFGVRRDINSSIYDILVVRDCLASILNVFARDAEYTISAPVWEYFLAYNKDDLKTLLKGSIHRSLLNRNPILDEALDGLLREIILDKANGFVGKTVIHPSHLRYVNGMQAVTREEYDDAVQVLGTNGGVVKSAQANKMNESNPHRSWAKKVLLRSQAYGVIQDEASYLALFPDA